MKTKVKIIMMSHLSDLQEGASLPPVIYNDKINFVKWLLIKFPNTDEEIDVEKEYELFQTKFTKRLAEGQ
jgi:hypothetical protein